jgi:hypothetical protein
MRPWDLSLAAGSFRISVLPIPNVHLRTWSTEYRYVLFRVWTMLAQP